MFKPSWFALSPGRWYLASLFLLMSLIGVSVGCVPEPRVVLAPSNSEEWQAWQVIETKTGLSLSFPEWLKHLEGYEIVYLGEEHYNHHHIDAAIRILSGLMADGIRPAIGMEMFGWDGQSALDSYLSNGTHAREEFLEQAQWKSNWGGAFDNYEPLVLFARNRHLSIYAMNPPKTLIRRVAKFGLAQAREGVEWKQWGMEQEEIVDDPGYRARIFDQLRRCHGGGTDEDYRTMYEASMVRDEGMAKTLVAALEHLRRDAAGIPSIILSYTGGGHIQYNLPIPDRVARRLSGRVRQTTIYLTSFDRTRTEDIRTLLQERVADYIWLTPVSGQGPPQRCR